METTTRQMAGRRWTFLFLLLLLARCSCQAEDAEEKAPPEKGDGCANLATIDVNLFVNPCDPLITQEIPVNAFDFTMYASLPPFTSGYFIPIAYLIVNFLNVALPQYDIRFPTRDELGTVLGLLSFFVPANPNDDTIIAKVTLVNAGVDVIQQTPRSWWWEYRLVFSCEYGNADPNRMEGAPITNILLKQAIQDDMDRELQTLGYVLQSLAVYENSRRILGLALDDPRVTDRPFFFSKPESRTEGGVRVPPPVKIPPSTVESWEHWRQAVGVILWIIIVVVGVTITHLAGIRHRQRSRMDLTNPDGVEALLDVQWRKHPDDTFHIYHRNKYAYQEYPPPPIEEEGEEVVYDEEERLVREHDGTEEFA